MTLKKSPILDAQIAEAAAQTELPENAPESVATKTLREIEEDQAHVSRMIEESMKGGTCD